MATIDLSTLPKPTVIQELDHQVIVDRQLQSFLNIWNEKRVLFPDLPEYTVEMLESDPFAIDNEAESWREVLLRAEINDVFRATLLYFAKGGNLDHLAAFHDVVRMPGETDDRLLNRVLLAIMGRSTGGPKERYQSIAMSSLIGSAGAWLYTSPSSQARPMVSPALISSTRCAQRSPRQAPSWSTTRSSCSRPSALLST